MTFTSEMDQVFKFQLTKIDLGSIYIIENGIFASKIKLNHLNNKVVYCHLYILLVLW